MATASFAAIGCGGSPVLGPRDGAGGADSSAGDVLGAGADTGAETRADAGAEVSPECAALASLMLSNARIASGTFGQGQRATLEVTLTNTGAADDVGTAGVLLASSLPGVAITGALVPVPALRAGEARRLTWMAAVDSSVPNGAVVRLSARVVGGGALACPGSPRLDFSLTVSGAPIGRSPLEE